MLRTVIWVIAGFLVSNCASQSGPETVTSSAATSLLRNCATLTNNCHGVDVLSWSIPDYCQTTDTGAFCSATTRSTNIGTSSRQRGKTYTEYLAVMNMGDRTCSLNAIYQRNRRQFGPGEFALIGIWDKKADTTQYRSARYLRDATEVADLDDAASFAKACASLA